MPRKYTIVHEQYLLEWLVKNYPPGTWKTNVRLGAVSPELIKRTANESERRALKIWAFQADAVVFLKDKIVIVEALVRPEWWKLLQLEEYERAFRSTPEFAKYKDLPVEKVLLTTIDSPFHRAMAEERGIRVVLYQPPWILPYMQRYGVRRRRPPGAYLAR